MISSSEKNIEIVNIKIQYEDIVLYVYSCVINESTYNENFIKSSLVGNLKIYKNFVWQWECE